MLAAAASSRAAWVSLVAALVFLAMLVALVVDRARTKHRLAQVERSEALLRTDLADARRELAALRDVLRDGARQRSDRPGPGDPTSPVG